MTIRLAFAGASGTGKSTLARGIASMLNLRMCDVGSREVAKSMGFDNPYDVDKAGKRREFQQALIEQKHAWEVAQIDHGFVSDRTHFDNLAYTAMHEPELADSEAFRALVGEAMGVYTHVVFCSIASFHNLAGDPARVADLDYHRQFEKKLWSLFRSDLCPSFDFLSLGRGDGAARLDNVRRFIRP